MAQYKITITNQKRRSQELLEIHEYENAPFFSRSMYENTVASMFFYAAQNIDFRFLDAVVEREGEKVLHLVMDTTQDGSTVYSILKVARPREKYRFIRKMIVAE